MKKKWIWQMLLPVLAVSMLSVSLTAVLLNGYYRREQLRLASGIFQGAKEAEPELGPVLLEVLKEYTDQGKWQEGALADFGYGPQDFQGKGQGRAALLAGAGLLTGVGLYLAVFWIWRRREAARIRALADYLEKVQAGGPGLFLENAEGEYARLQDMIYKEVTELYQTREAALAARDHFAENLANIAHQLKTPVTAMSLSVQMLEEETASEYPAKIKRQLKRLIHLEEALLLLSRIDAGTLSLHREQTDAFTVLTLAAENLQELSEQAGVRIEVPEQEAVFFSVDLEWTMEAVMNLMKNCMEHSPAGGTVRCSYEENPLYVRIWIQDEGEGFAKEDLPRLFERFYRGQHAAEGGIGIGLALARELLEMQGGMVSAWNLPGGGACFEIRMYRH